jgi:hypothetical protein
MYGESGSRFIHATAVIEFARRLVREYDEWNLKQNKKYYNEDHPELKKFEPGTTTKDKRRYFK